MGGICEIKAYWQTVANDELITESDKIHKIHKADMYASLFDLFALWLNLWVYSTKSNNFLKVRVYVQNSYHGFFQNKMIFVSLRGLVVF